MARLLDSYVFVAIAAAGCGVRAPDLIPQPATCVSFDPSGGPPGTYVCVGATTANGWSQDDDDERGFFDNETTSCEEDTSLSSDDNLAGPSDDDDDATLFEDSSD